MIGLVLLMSVSVIGGSSQPARADVEAVEVVTGVGAVTLSPDCGEGPLSEARTASFQRETRGLRGLWYALHWVGHGELYLLLLCLVAVGRHWRRALDFSVAMGLSAWLTGVLKGIVNQPRPGWLGETLWIDVGSASSGFPSGHVATAMGLLLLVRSRRAVLAVGLFVLLMVLARVGVGAHSPAQVLGGVCLGTFTVVAAPALVRLTLRDVETRIIRLLVGALAMPYLVLLLVDLPLAESVCQAFSQTRLLDGRARAMGGGLGLWSGAMYGGWLMFQARLSGRFWGSCPLFMALAYFVLPASASLALVTNFGVVLGVWAVARRVHRRRRPATAAG